MDEPRSEVSEAGSTAFEDYPLTRSEYISAMVHFYRGELGRADMWRARLDPTTNWAVVTAGAMLSFSFNTSDHSHVSLLLGLLLITIFLGFEARRFRYFDVWRSRVRMIEENFWIPMLRRNLISPRENWREFVVQDLDRPTFKLSFIDAIGVRLRYNYLWIYLVILIAWLTKLNIHPWNASSLEHVVERARIGPVSGIVVMVLVGLAYAVATWLAIRGGHRRDVMDEVRGVAPAAAKWKT